MYLKAARRVGAPYGDSLKIGAVKCPSFERVKKVLIMSSRGAKRRGDLMRIIFRSLSANEIATTPLGSRNDTFVLFCRPE